MPLDIAKNNRLPKPSMSSSWTLKCYTEATTTCEEVDEEPQQMRTPGRPDHLDARLDPGQLPLPSLTKKTHKASSAKATPRAGSCRR
ncbi:MULTISPECIES: hypothetical protein [Streptomyces]|uniref:hypothetical protein n=1 Tax=Streptomyces TaxID=1883 RepID=UPI00363D84C8